VKFYKSILATFLSRKFLATAACVAIVIWFDAKYNERLNGIDEKKAGHLITMMVTTSGTLGAILIGYLGFQTLQTRFGLSGVAQVMAERRDEHIVTEHTERIVDEGAPGAPARRPWTPIPDDDN